MRQYLYRIPLPNSEKHFLEGLCLEYGIDSEQSLEKAYKKYTLASMADHPLAMYKLAEIELV
jgi:TPR repeat protein